MAIQEEAAKVEEKVVTAVTHDGWVLLQDKHNSSETLKRTTKTHLKAHGRLPRPGEVFKFRCARSLDGQKYCCYHKAGRGG